MDSDWLKQSLGSFSLVKVSDKVIPVETEKISHENESLSCYNCFPLKLWLSFLPEHLNKPKSRLLIGRFSTVGLPFVCRRANHVHFTPNSSTIWTQGFKKCLNKSLSQDSSSIRRRKDRSTSVRLPRKTGNHPQRIKQFQLGQHEDWFLISSRS